MFKNGTEIYRLHINTSSCSVKQNIKQQALTHSIYTVLDSYINTKMLMSRK